MKNSNISTLFYFISTVIIVQGISIIFILFEFNTLLFLSVLLAFALCLSTLLFYQKQIKEPFNSITQTSLKILGGEENLTLNVSDSSVFKTLTDAFNEVLDNLRMVRGYVDDLPTPVLVVDKEMTIQVMNKAGAQLLGRTQEQCKNEKCYDLFKTDHCNTPECRVKQAMETEKTLAGETTSYAAEADLHVQYTGAPVRDKTGQVIGGLELLTNITDLKEFQFYLTRSIEKLMSAMEKFSNGDLTVQVEHERDDDDMFKLLKSFNFTVDKMSDMITKVAEAVDATASASNEISSSAEEMAAGAQEQGAQTQEVASAVEQMSKTIIETAESSSKAANSSKESKSEADYGVNKIDATKDGMQRIVEAAQGTGQIIKDLTGKTAQIDEITQVIDDIADQTNLLALNAAIEAARAGEQGRGFAVVADEVRKLAERTTKATKEIAETIKAIQVDVEQADLSMNEAGEAVSNGMKLTEEVSETFDTILKNTDEVTSEISQVASASEEQSATAEEISKNIESINSVANESAAGIQQIAATADDLNRLTSGLSELVGNFKVATIENYKSVLRNEKEMIEN